LKAVGDGVRRNRDLVRGANDSYPSQSGFGWEFFFFSSRRFAVDANVWLIAAVWMSLALLGLLTFLAGAEIDPGSLRRHLKPALAIGAASRESVFR
jgi:hypothetical protein